MSATHRYGLTELSRRFGQRFVIMVSKTKTKFKKKHHHQHRPRIPPSLVAHSFYKSSNSPVIPTQGWAHTHSTGSGFCLSVPLHTPFDTPRNTIWLSVFIKTQPAPKRKCTTLEFSIEKPVVVNAKRSQDKCFHTSSCSALLTVNTHTFFIVRTGSPFSSVSGSGKVLAVGQPAENGFKCGTTERDVKMELNCSQMKRRQLK